MKKNISIAIFASALLFSGCAGKELLEPKEFKCEDNSVYSSIHNKCLVMNEDIKGVVESKECIENKCSAIVLDERSRRIKIEANDNLNIGDTVSIVLFKKGEIVKHDKSMEK